MQRQPCCLDAAAAKPSGRIEACTGSHQTRGFTVTFLLYRVQMDLLAHPDGQDGPALRTRFGAGCVVVRRSNHANETQSQVDHHKYAEQDGEDQENLRELHRGRSGFEVLAARCGRFPPPARLTTAHWLGRFRSWLLRLLAQNDRGAESNAWRRV